MDENRTNVILNEVKNPRSVLSAAKNLSSFTAFRTSLRQCLRTHLSIAGGRKTMAAYGMVVAQILFDDNDHVWHVRSENWRPENERVMHAKSGDTVSLPPVPVLRWSSVSRVMTELAIGGPYRYPDQPLWEGGDHTVLFWLHENQL